MANRGRPPFKPTAKLARVIEELMSCGESEEAVARAIDIDVDTMRKHFPESVATGRAKRRREVIEMLYASARKGNVAAIKKLEEMTRVATAMAVIEQEDDSPQPKPQKLGKKEAAAREAETAGLSTEWGDDLRPAPGTEIKTLQ